MIFSPDERKKKVVLVVVEETVMDVVVKDEMARDKQGERGRESYQWCGHGFGRRGWRRRGWRRELGL
jgi:hypothetical protein